jgi:hypothetical protein
MPSKRRGNSHSAPAGRLESIIFMAVEGGGGEVVECSDDCTRDFGPGFKSQKSLMVFFWRTTARNKLANNRKCSPAPEIEEIQERNCF